MKVKHYLWVAFTAALLAGCDNDHSDLWNEINSQGERIEALETWQKQVNNDISALQQLLNTTDYITDVTPVMLNGEQVGYTIRFLHSDPITIYNGAQGEKGEQGDKGDKGDKGDRGEIPQISARQQPDGNWYWVLNGELLKDQAGNYIRANGDKGEQGDKGESGEAGSQGEQGPQGEQGKPGISAPTPQLLIGSSLPAGVTIKTDGGTKNATAWYLSVDDGATWYRVSGKDGQDGTDGRDGSSLFSSVKLGVDEVSFFLKNGSKFSVPIYKGIVVKFTLPAKKPGDPDTDLDMTKMLYVQPSTVINYAFSGGDPNTYGDLALAVLPAEGKGWEGEVNTTNKTITLSGDGSSETGRFLIMLTDSKGFVNSYTLPVFAFKGKGDSGDPYTISTPQTLQRLAELVNAGNNYEGIYFKLENDIDLSGICGAALNDGNGINWIPIGNNNNNIKFAGNFDGDNHTIQGLYIKTYNAEYQGLFGAVDSKGTVKNLTVEGEVAGSDNTGGIAGHNAGIITECTNKSTVNENMNGYNIGGIAGNNIGTISGCSNLGKVTGYGTVGGIAGNQRTGISIGCSNSGDIKGVESVGGILGSCKSGISTACIACYNTGSVEETYFVSYAGGIVGYAQTSNSIACYSTGTISGSHIGGIVGECGYDPDFSSCYWSSTASISGIGSGSSTTPPKEVDGSSVNWASGSGDNNAMSTMNSAIDTWNNSHSSDGKACKWKYIENTDSETKGTCPLKLQKQ